MPKAGNPQLTPGLTIAIAVGDEGVGLKQPAGHALPLLNGGRQLAGNLFGIATSQNPVSGRYFLQMRKSRL